MEQARRGVSGLTSRLFVQEADNDLRRVMTLYGLIAFQRRGLDAVSLRDSYTLVPEIPILIM
jgi:hypothetical protein